MICQKCGKTLSDTANFCSNCGAPTREPGPTTPKESEPGSDARMPETTAPEPKAADAESSDATTTDAKSSDATTTDAESSDATTADAEPSDATTTDAESSDATTTDAEPSDAITADAEPSDAITADAKPSEIAAEPEAPDPSTLQEGEPGSGARVPDAAAPEPAASTPAPVRDMVIRKKRIFISEGRLVVDGTYYRKAKRRFKKKKGQISIPLALVKGAFVRHASRFRKILAFVLLFLIFAAGSGISGCFGWHTWAMLHTPYRAEEEEDLQNDLQRLSEGDSELARIETELEELTSLRDELDVQLSLYQTKRQEEIVRSVLSDPDLDAARLLSADDISDAYRRYLEDLLEAFLNDSAIHEWLYPYYAYSLELGENNYIADEMPFYTVSGENGIFSPEVDSPDTFLRDRYNYDLYQHIYYTGRIYITGAEFLNRVLHVPDYVANGAVFLKAYGGVPDPDNFDVPDWETADYKAFWKDAASYLDSPDPCWISYGLSAADFGLDWNSLINEQAYYDAYLKFMDAIAPGLGVFDMVSYSAGDDAYAGLYYDITGKEASVTEIMTLYIEDHPGYLEETMPETAKLPSSLDGQIETAQEKLAELEAKTDELTEKRDELKAFMDSGETVRADYDRLEQEIQAYREKLTHNLIIFGSICLFLLLMALIILIAFLCLLKKPKHMMVLTLEDGTEAAFSLRFCPKENIKSLLEMLPTQKPDDPHT